MMVLDVRHITKTFGETAVSDDVSFAVDRGRILAIVGPNGAGKSTLLRQVCGLITPDSGRILFEGRPLESFGPDLYRHLSAVLEDSSLAYTFLKGWDNLYYQGALYGLNRRQTEERAALLLDALDLRRHMGKRVGDWSRGTQQKLALVVGLLARPQLMLLDEPTLGLDVVSKRDFMAVVRQCADEGMSVIITSHQSEVIDGMADDMLLLESGRVRWKGGSADFMREFQRPGEALEDTLLRLFRQTEHDANETTEAD